jgi:hypothetical protein
VRKGAAVGVAVVIAIDIGALGFLAMEGLFHLQDWRSGERVFGDKAVKFFVSFFWPFTVWQLNWDLIGHDLAEGKRRRDLSCGAGS